jgi:hypothetical protein
MEKKTPHEIHDLHQKQQLQRVEGELKKKDGTKKRTQEGEH